MTIQSSQPQTIVSDEAVRLTHGLLYSRAARLAWRGSYQAAEELLRGVLKPEGQIPSRLDLLARIRAQQGAFREAEELWQQVLRLKPDDPGTVAALARLRAIRNRPVSLVPVALLGGLIVVAWLSFLTIRGLAPRPVPGSDRVSETVKRLELEHTARQDEQLRSLSVQIAQIAQIDSNLTASARAQTTVAERFSELQSAIRDLQSTAEEERQTRVRSDAVRRTTQQSFEEQNAALLAAIGDLDTVVRSLKDELASAATNQPVGATVTPAETAVALPKVPDTREPEPPIPTVPNLPSPLKAQGITSEWLDGYLVLRFETPLFDRDASFRMGARSILKSAAKAIARTQTKVEIEIVGLAEVETPNWPWSKPIGADALGLARAHKVAGYLKTLEIFPEESIRVNNAATRQFYPTQRDSPDAFPKTVVFRVRMRK